MLVRYCNACWCDVAGAMLGQILIQVEDRTCALGILMYASDWFTYRVNNVCHKV